MCWQTGHFTRPDVAMPPSCLSILTRLYIRDVNDADSSSAQVSHEYNCLIIPAKSGWLVDWYWNYLIVSMHEMQTLHIRFLCLL